ncbi:MAG: tRNA lysidine(34) synthetase TilS [Balneolaceae bacterium]
MIENSVRSSLNLIPKRTPKIVLGVSGGPDSLALLYTFFKVEIDVLVVHINYGMRGHESDLDQELVEGLCTEWGFECCSIKLDSEGQKGNFQNWARKERYRIFRELKEVNDADCIATAHHKNDQIETIIQKVFRGSGVGAWQGMKIWDGELFRPLIHFSKAEILDYCEQEAIPFRVDESNLDSGYARNFIRNELEGKLDTFFPGWRSNILALSGKGEIADLALQTLMDSMLENEALQLSQFSKLDERLKPSVLKKFIALKNSEISLSKGALLQLLEIEKAQVGTSIQVSNSLSLVRDRAFLTLKKDSLKPFKKEFSKKEVVNGVHVENVEISISEMFTKENSLSLDAGLIKWPLTLKQWEEGDRFVPFGMKGSQKVSDHLTSRKITSSKKEKALILSDVDSTIYAIIFPLKASNDEIGTISEIIKCTEQTTEYLTITLK